MKKNMQRILATILTVIMMISMLPSNVFAADFDADMFVEPAVEAVSVPAEEQEVESTVEYIYEEPAETLQGSSDEIQTVEAADPAADEIEEETEAPVVDGTVTLKAEGSDYTVTVTYDVSAGLPADADIKVKEVMEKNKKYDDYVAQAADTIASDVESLNYVRLFDISLVDAAGNDLEPDNSVDVQIQLKDVVEVQDTTQVVHFAGEEEVPEAVKAAVDGDTVSFATEGFSIYAVLAPNETGDYARLQVNFINGEENFKTMWVKKADVDEGNLAQVLYDPGKPVAPAGKKFMGWTTSQTYNLETQRMKIDDVREVVEGMLTGDPGVQEGQEVSFYAIMLNYFELYYQDEDGNTYKTEHLLSAGDSATTVINQSYTVSGGSGATGFLGWKVKDTPDTEYFKNGTSFTATQTNTILVPVLGEGKWLHFNHNDETGEATYTPSVFIPADAESTVDYEPDEPTRDGYRFAGWYTAAEGGTKYEFNTNLSEYGTQTDITFYAHWEPESDASYKVILWAQKVTDDKDAQDENKTYDYIDTIVVENVSTTTVIDDTTVAPYKNYDRNKFGDTDLDHDSKGFCYRTYTIDNGAGTEKNQVSPDGKTVVNVYFDRSLMTIRFESDTELPNSSYETVTEYTESSDIYKNRYENNGKESGLYGIVDGAYVPLTGATGYLWENEATGKVYTNGPIYKRVQTGGPWYNPQYTYDYVATTDALGTSEQFEGFERNGYYYTSESHTTEVTYKGVRWQYKTPDGTVYTGSDFYTLDEVQKYVLEMTGLYGQTLAQNGYSWPRRSWYNIAYLSSFNGNLFGHPHLGSTPNFIKTKDSGSTNTTIIFYQQSVSNLNQYSEVDRTVYDVSTTSGFNITSRFQGTVPVSYSWTTSDALPTTWTSADDVDDEGKTNVKRGSNTYLHIRYDLVKNDIIFMCKGDEIADSRIEGVPYSKSIAEYAANVPDESAFADKIRDDERFVGWYEDPEGVNPVNWNTTMPLANKVVYAVMKPVMYHVKVDMDGSDPLPAGQKTDFWLPHGEKINGTNFLGATKTVDGNSYTLVGYYKNQEFAQKDLWSFESLITKDLLTDPSYLYQDYQDDEGIWHYDAARSGNDDMPTAEHPEYANTIGIFRLYARWRNDNIEGGLHIRYKNNASDEGNVYVDPLSYVDLADVITADVAPAESVWPEGMRFDGWKLAAGEVYQPGDIFVADSKDANKEDGTYWITLTATYVETENRTPTHITWYKNDGSGESYHTSPDLSINEKWPVFGTSDYPIEIGQTIPTRTGYKFLGWARDVETPVDGDGNPLTGEDGTTIIVNTETAKTTADFLEYREADGKFYLPGTNTEVTHVAADEVLPYHGLYAIWKPTFFTIVHSSDPENPEVITDHDFNDPFNMTDKVYKDYIYGGYKNEEGVFCTENGTAMTPVPGATYYLKEVDKKYLNPMVYTVRSKYTHRLRQFFILTDIDPEKEGYTSVGVDVTGDSSKTIDFGSTVYNKFTVNTKDENGNTISSSDVDTVTLFTVPGYLGIQDANEYVGDEWQNKSITLRAYFVTKDSVKVSGFVQKTLNFNDLRVEDWTSKGIIQTRSELSPVCTPVTRSLTSSLKSAHKYQIKVASENSITITKVDNGTNTAQTVKAGDNTGKITNIGKANYVFAGWYEDASYSKVADFSNVSKDMTVYAKYVKASTVKLSFAKKSVKAGDVTLKATLKITDQPDIEDVAVDCDFADTSYAVDFTGVKTSKSGKSIVNTYSGTVKFSGLANNSAFSAVISYRTPDGTSVSLAAKSCKYNSGTVTVR